MKIGIDIDDTVMNTFDVIEEAARYFDKYFLENKGYQDITKYDFHERFYWTSEEKKAFFNYFRKNKLYLKAKPKGDALYYLEKLYHCQPKVSFASVFTFLYSVSHAFFRLTIVYEYSDLQIQ